MTVAHDTPIGPLHLAASPRGLTRLGFVETDDDHGPVEVLDLARRELDAYFAGTLRRFTVPVDLAGHPRFDRRVLAGLDAVGHGETVAYGELAAAVGLAPGDARRVGGAMARNPVAVVVPCHRVVGADGSLTGYAGGLTIKRALIDHESAEAMLFSM